MKISRESLREVYTQGEYTMINLVEDLIKHPNKYDFSNLPKPGTSFKFMELCFFIRYYLFKIE